jgi:polysaccharide export outer membrane protein
MTVTSHQSPITYKLLSILLLSFCVLMASLMGQVPSPRGDILQAGENELNQRLKSMSSIYRNDGEYRLGGGDLIDVSVYGVQMFEHSLRINSSGYINLPLVGEMKVSGKTASEVEQELKQRLHPDIIKDPHVSVFITEYRSQPVLVLGSVNSPGQYQITRPVRLADMIAMAGGLGPRASDQIKLQSRTLQTVTLKDATGAASKVEASSGNVVTEIDLKDLLVRGNLSLNVPIKGGDVINVLEREDKLFYVIGEVNGPGAFALPEGDQKFLLTQAIAWAGGPQRTAKLSKGVLIRYEKGSDVRTEISLDFKKILAGVRPDIGVQSEDVIFIPGSRAKTIGYGMLNIVPSLARDAIVYGPRVRQ